MEEIREILLNKELTIIEYNNIVELSNKKIKELEQKKHLENLLKRLENFCDFKEPCELIQLFKTLDIINLESIERSDNKTYSIIFKFINTDDNIFNIKLNYYIDFCKKKTEFEYFHEININSKIYENFTQIIELFNWNYVSASELKYVFTEMFKIFSSLDYMHW